MKKTTLTESFVTSSQSETEKIAFDFADKIKSPAVITLEGELGAGKTAFARGLINGLGKEGTVSSPTFGIVNEYKTEKGQAAHFDLYRVSDNETLEMAGFFDYIEKAVVIVEWPDIVRSELGENVIEVTIRQLQNNNREITIKR
ncbi:MAG: tRNA (adenosine(37)-N6)-threonylcarbamoyltransferase complex ATPase subunit type 1 TsaE [Ruminococcaceae bacterium]|nr:tRNA (adenosine(37)-N6)-threonylcarbamoyltransferase complex ATPase subunit type 1 TsaE [Oscillospiraceae bacterium]